MKLTRTGTWCLLGLAGVALVLGSTPARAGVTVGFDAPTLNELLPALTLDEVAIPISEGRSLGVRLEELRVTGFDPGGEESRPGRILTSLRLRVPQLGLVVSLEPELSVRVVESGGRSLLELRFEKAELPPPFPVNVASFLPPLRFPADSLFLVNGMRGDVQIRSRLTEIKMGVKVIRLDFELTVVP